MSQQTDESGGVQSEEPVTDPVYTTDIEDSTSLLDGPTPVPGMGEEGTKTTVIELTEFQVSLSSSSNGGSTVVYSDYYDRIREDAEWNELGQMCYVPLYSHRSSHGSFSSDRLSSEGSVSPSLPSPIGDHLKNKRDSSTSVQFPIVAGAPQPFPDPFSDREPGWAGNGNNTNNGRRGGSNTKPSYATIMEPKGDYGLGGEYGSSSQDSHTDVFGGSQESLNNIYGPGQNSGYGGYGRPNNRSNSFVGGGRMMGGAGAGQNRRQHYNSGSGYGNNYGSNDYSNYGGYDNYDQAWRGGDIFESTNKYGGPITHGPPAPSAVPSAPLPNAFSKANINDEQKNNLMANLARLCNQRSY